MKEEALIDFESHGIDGVFDLASESGEFCVYEWITFSGVVEGVEVAGRQMADLAIVAVLRVVEVGNDEADEVPEGAVEVVFDFVLSAG